jgi:hypothetical protein
MVKIYSQGLFDFPKRKRRLAWHIEVLCGNLLQREIITQKDIGDFWDEVRRRAEKYRPRWQRENLYQEAKDGLKRLLDYYEKEAEANLGNENIRTNIIALRHGLAEEESN